MSSHLLLSVSTSQVVSHSDLVRWGNCKMLWNSILANFSPPQSSLFIAFLNTIAKNIAFGQDMCYIICPSIQDYLLMSRTQFFNKNVWFFWKIVVKSMSLVIQTYFRCKLSLLQLHLMTFDDALFMVTKLMLQSSPPPNAVPCYGS